MTYISRAAQELDLLLQEGQANDPLLADGLVRLYAPELFRFAWEHLTPPTEAPSVRRLLARRTVSQALTAALTQIHRFQEQPGTFPWLLRLTCQHAPSPAEPARLAQPLAQAFSLAPEDLAYILKIPERRVVVLLETDLSPPAVSPRDAKTPVSAGSRASFTPLTREEITTLIEHLQTAAQSTPTANPRFAREFALLGVALLIIIGFVRLSPNRVLYLPTPPPPPTATLSPWDITPVPLPTSASPPSDIVYEPANPYLLWQKTHTLPGPSSFIRVLAASPTAPLLAVGSNNGPLTLWDLTTFTQTQSLEGHTGGVQSLAFSPDGKILASGGFDGVVNLWEMPAGHLLQVFEDHPNNVTGVAFSPDGQILAVTAGKELWFWQVNGGAKMATYASFDQALTGVSYSPDGRFLAVGEASGTGWVLRAADAFPLLSFPTTYSVFAPNMVFFPDSQGLIAMSRDNLPMVLRLEGNTEHLEAEIIKTLMEVGEEGYTPPVYDFLLSGDGRFVAISTQGGNVYLWDTATWTPCHAPLTLNDFDSSTYPLALSYDHRTLVMGRSGGQVIVWQLEDVSGQAGRFTPPRFFQRAESDLRQVTYTVRGDDLQPVWGQADFTDLERVSELVGFPIKVPIIRLLGGDHQIDTIFYDPSSHYAYLSAWASNESGLLMEFNLRQKRVEPGQPTLDVSNFPFRTWDVIGLTALVEAVQIGSFEGELVTGGWMYLEQENRDWLGEFPQSGDEITYVTRWSDDTGGFSVRWMEGEILYDLQTYLDPVMMSDPDAVIKTLLELAQTMFSPQEISLPWNFTPFDYQVTAGDTCARLAERFYTTVEIIRHLNRLGASCLLTAGQTLFLPTPSEPYLTADLNCDRQDETILLLRDTTDPALITGIAIELVTASNLVQRVWQTTAVEMGVLSLHLPELFTIGECEQLLAISGGTPTASRTRIFRWDGTSAWAVLDGPGRPYSANYSIAALPQNPEDPFVIPLIQYVPSTHPAAGPCPNEVRAYTYDGARFEAGEMRLVLGECAGLP